MDFILTCVGSNVQKQLTGPVFSFTLPVPSGSCVDADVGKSQIQLFNEGSNINPMPGDYILKGTTFNIPNLWSHPYNKPLVLLATSNYKQQVVRCEYLRQDYPIYGNTFYSVYAIIQNKSGDLDMICQIKQQHDSRFRKQADCGNIPVSLLADVFNIENDMEFFSYINPDNDIQIHQLMESMFRRGHVHREYYKTSRDLTQYDNDGNVIKTKQQVALEILAKQMLHPEFKDDIIPILEKYIHPINKHYFTTLGEICRKLCKVYLDPNCADDKDDMVNKRVKTVHSQIAAEFRSKMQVLFSKTMFRFFQQNSDVKYLDLLELPDLVQQLTTQANNLSTKLSESMKRSFTSSNSTQTSDIKKVLDEEKTVHHGVMQKNEVVIREKGQSKIQWSRKKVNMSQYGVTCAISTPEAGAKVGCYISPNIWTYVTPGYLPNKFISYVKQHSKYLQKKVKHTMDIKVNYITIGYVLWSDWKQMYLDIMQWKTQNAFKQGKCTPGRFSSDADQLFCSFYYSVRDNYLNYMTCIGRMMTPIIKGQWDGVSTLRQMLTRGTVIFACKAMQDNFVIFEYHKSHPDYPIDVSAAQKDKYTLDDFPQTDPNQWYYFPYGLVGHFPAVNPFIGHLKSVRASYSANQLKQSITMPYNNHMVRCSNQTLIINQTQFPSIDTSVSRTLYGNTSLVQNVYTGFVQWMYNQEDAIIASAGYIYRNGQSSSAYRTYVSTCDSVRESFSCIDSTKHLHCNRLVNNQYNMASKIGERVESGDTLIHKVRMVRDQLIDQTVLKYELNHPKKCCCISNVIYNSLTERRQKLTRVYISRYPIQGDKFASRNAQKGTIGKIVNEWELPCDKYGRVLNFVFSCPSTIKRETYGQLAEPALNNYLIQNEIYTCNIGIDEHNTDIIRQIANQPLEKMYAPTGQFKQLVFAGCIGYAALGHLASQKLRARDGGDVDKTSRQPDSKHGTKNKNAMRAGTLEQNSLYASGACNMLIDHYGVNSSNTQYYYCKSCGRLQVYYEHSVRKWRCNECGIGVTVLKGGRNFGAMLVDNILWSLGAEVKLDTDMQ